MGQPGWDNEDTADEFATVFMRMMKQERAALEAAQRWASKTSEKEALSKVWIDDRHTLSPQRARNIVKWLNESNDRMRRWQKVLIPNMQTEALLGLAQGNEVWADKAAVRVELGRRGR
jgi:hypothetical protein